MAKIKLNGDTSGYIEISAPAVSYNNTLELGPGTKILTNLDNTFTGVSTFSSDVYLGNDIYLTDGSSGYEIVEVDQNDIRVTGKHIHSQFGVWTRSTGVNNRRNGIDGDNNDLRLYANSAEKVRITGDGKLGINITNPTRQLEIYSSSHATAALQSDTQSSLFFSDPSDTNIGQISYMHSGNYMYFRVNDAERLRIGSDGKMGLGTNSPAYLAHIHNSGTGSGDNSYLHFTTGDTGATGSDGLTIGVAANETAYINFRESGSLVLATSGTERFRIASDGQATFDKGAVGGANQVISRFQAESSRRLDIVWHDSGSLMGFNTPSNHSYIFKTNNTERVRITNAGRMGIDSGSPISKLQVGSHTFNGGNGMHSDARVGMSNHGNLTGLMLASTYNSGTHPEYGLVFVQGASTSSYNVWGLCPDGPAKGNSLNFHYAPQASNIHAPGYRKFQMTGDGYLLKPSHPSFRVGRHSDYNHTGGQPVQFNTTSGTAHLNQGNHYNTTNHRFVAPVAGVYQFSACVIVNGLSSPTDVTDLFYLFKNGSHMAYSMRRARYVNNYTGTGGYFVDFLSNVNILMAANDYCDIRVRLSVSVHGNATYTWFSGTLVG